MARGSTQATGAATSAQTLSNGLQGNSQALYGSLAPELESEAAHPAGYAPADVAAMNTAGQQSAGGSMAGAVGQGALLASRTKNAGTADAAIAKSAQTAGQQASNAALKTQTANANLKQQQRRSALTGLQGLYNTNTSGSIGALGQVAPNVNANTNAANSSWDWSSALLQPFLGAGAKSYGSYVGSQGS